MSWLENGLVGRKLAVMPSDVAKETLPYASNASDG